MKIKPEHIEALQSLVIPSHSEELHAQYRDANLSDKRYRWDLLYRVPYHARVTVIDEIYKYANDTHIDTVLRKITNTK
jgi:hypothetical protein